ncbi:YhgE/Pip domain-containing protein [Mariniluteicoccus endophyticus]
MFRTFRFGTELRRFGRTRMTRLAIIAAICIPLLYGALYLWAFWNPTEHLDRVPVALVNVDTGATKDDTRVTAGDDLTDELVKKNNLAWTKTSPTEAQQGLEEGRYFAVLTIPADFSKAVTTMGTENPVHAPLEVTYDDAQGYTARTILASVMREVRTAAADAIGEEAVDKLFVGFSDIHSGLVQAHDGANELADGTAKARDGSAGLADGATQLADGSAQLATGATTLATKTGEAADGAHKLHDGTTQASTGAKTLATGAGQLATGSSQLATGAAQLATGAKSASDGATKLNDGLSQLAQGTKDLPTKTAQLADGAEKVAAGDREIATKVTTVTTTLNTGLDDVKRIAEQLPDSDPNKARILQGLETARGRSTSVQSQVNQLADGADKVAQGNRALADATPQLASGIQQAATGASSLDTGLKTLSGGASTLATKTGELRDGAQKLSSAADQLASGLVTLDQGAAQLDTGMGQLRDGASLLATKTGELRDGAGRLKDGAVELRDGIVKLDDGAHELATKLGEAVDKVPNLSDTEREANAKVISAPVSLEQSWQHQAESQGEGFAPYFIGLALYVGAMILWMLLRPVSNRSLAAPVTALRVVLSNWLPAVVLGLGQAMLLLAVLIFGLGLEPVHLLVTLAFAALVSLAYVSLQQTFNVVLGSSVGRVVTLVVLTMQITSSGGTYPAETTPQFFQTLNATLPLTQVVNGLRCSITGDLNHQFWYAVAYLVVLALAALAVSTAAAARKRVWSISRLHPAISL